MYPHLYRIVSDTLLSYYVACKKTPYGAFTELLRHLPTVTSAYLLILLTDGAVLHHGTQAGNDGNVCRGKKQAVQMYVVFC